MPALRILNLSRTGIESAPTSVSNLECLVALLLSQCYELNHVPSLAKLRRLISLDLSNTAITEAPPGLELLINLRRLNFKSTKHLKMSTATIIPKLTNLQSLNCFSKSTNVSAQDLQGLEELEEISASFCDIKEFSAYVRSFFGRDRVLQNYRFTVTKTRGYPDYFKELSYATFMGKSVAFEGLDLGNGAAVLPEDIKALHIYKCHQWSRCLCHGLSIRINNNPCRIDRFKISTCKELEYLCCFSPNCPFCSSVQLVNDLQLEILENLQNIVEPTLAPPLRLTTPFSHLRHLQVRRCHSMKTLLTPALAAQLQSLETICIRYCKSMEEIVSDGSDLSKMVLFSHLRDLKVFGCDSMKTLLTPALAAQLRSLETIEVGYCGWMKEIVSDGSDLSKMVLPGSGNHSDHAINFPNLNRMTLTELLELNCVYRGIMLCPSFKFLEIRRCQKLTEPPQIQPAPQIEKIPGGYICQEID